VATGEWSERSFSMDSRNSSAITSSRGGSFDDDISIVLIAERFASNRGNIGRARGIGSWAVFRLTIERVFSARSNDPYRRLQRETSLSPLETYRTIPEKRTVRNETVPRADHDRHAAQRGDVFMYMAGQTES